MRVKVIAQALGPSVAELGESPFWSPEENCVWWVDVTGKQVLRTDATTGATTRWPAPRQVGFIARAGGALLVGMELGLFRFDPHAGTFEFVPGTGLPAGTRFNDATVDAAGRLWASSMCMANDRADGVIWVLAGDRRLQPVADGFRTPNGLAFDVVRSRLYFSDSHPTVRRVWHAVFDGRTQRLGTRRVFAEFGETDGRPDGAVLDQEGNYWIACLEAGLINVSAPTGERRRSVELHPCRPLTKLSFGPPGRIFVTSKATPVQPRASLLTAILP